MDTQETIQNIETYLKNLQATFDEFSKNSPSASAERKKILEEGSKSFHEIKKLLTSSSFKDSLSNASRSLIQEGKEMVAKFISDDNIETLQKSGEKLFKESKEVIKDHPISTILIAVTLGIILGRR